jgi:hypothetical protein
MGKTTLTDAATYDHVSTTETTGTSSANFSLVTTPKTEIIDNKILLPSKPEGAILLNLMMVYDDENTIAEYDGVYVLIDVANSRYYAQLNEPSTIIGSGVVSYLTRIS